MLFGASVSDNLPITQLGSLFPTICLFLCFENLCMILLLASFVRDLRWPNLHICFHQFNIYFAYFTLDGGIGTGSGHQFLETRLRYRGSGDN